MKNIDDFVREKLGNAPENRDNAAAWLKMKTLLDNEMPEKAAPILFRWGKPLAFFGISILAASLCIGGYQLIAFRNNNTLPTNNAAHNNNTHQHTNTSKQTNTASNQHAASSTKTQTANNNKPSNPTAQSNNSNIQTNDASIKQTTNNTSTNTNKQTATNNNKQTTNKQASNNAQLLVSNQATTTPSNNKTLQANVAIAIDSKPSAAQPNNFAKSSTALATQNNKNNSQPLNNTPSPSAAAKPINHLAATISTPASKPAAATFSSSTAAAKPTLQATTIIPQSSNNNTKPLVAPITAITTDSISILSTVRKQSYSRLQPLKAATITEDTIGQKTIAIASPSPAAQPTVAASSTAIVPNSTAANTSNTAAATTAPTATKKKGKNNIFTKIDLPAAAQNISKEIRNAQFFLGFMGGANYSVANNNFVGIQFGPTGELVFNPKWSLFVSLKYFNRSGANKTIQDSYYSETTTDTPYYKSGNNWNYLVNRDSTARQFQFSTLHSFELPITVRYTLKKFYLMTGLNLAYYLGINVEETRKDYPTQITQVIQTNASKPILQERKPSYQLADFGSRMGIGYILGAGYQISPAWQADLRIVQNFSTNKGSTDGAKALSKDFYKTPSLQISVGYQFNRGKSKPKYGPTDTP